MSSLRILVLGGTRFVGRHIADAFAASGDNVTLFNRGISDPVPRPGVENVRGDRAGDLSALAGRAWDAVVDTCGYTPGTVKRSARFFDSCAGHYLFISSVSVYDLEKASMPSVGEEAPLLQLPAGADPEQYADERYGALKSLCETEVRDAFAQRATIFRLGLVAGPHDPTDRFTYWPLRVAAGGALLAPPAGREIQYVDARDVAQFAVKAIRERIGGTFNLVVTPGSYTFGDLIAQCAEAAGSHPDVRWASEEFLTGHGVAPWSELPLWIPRSDSAALLLQSDPRRALAEGFRCRPLAETVRDTFAWASGARKLGALKAGLSRARERELLETVNS